MYTISSIINAIKSIDFLSIVDILAVSFIFYKAYSIIKETRAEQLLKGVALLVLLIPISDLFRLTLIKTILDKSIYYGFTLVVVIFQPEIRRALERIGRRTFVEKNVFDREISNEFLITQIVNAVYNLSLSSTGALIVYEQSTGLSEYIETGTKLDSYVSQELLENIFVVNTPLHDGATIIRRDRIAAAGCVLPLTNNQDISRSLGTRHRAAIGLSEISDALIIVVSEETGNISLAVNGKLTRNYDKDRLKDVLIRIIVRSNENSKETVRKRVVRWIKPKFKK